MCSRINSHEGHKVQIAKLTLYKQYKSTNLDDNLTPTRSVVFHGCLQRYTEGR